MATTKIGVTVDSGLLGAARSYADESSGGNLSRVVGDALTCYLVERGALAPADDIDLHAMLDEAVAAAGRDRAIDALQSLAIQAAGKDAS